MTTKTDYRTKLRAVFLAFIMVTSVVGMSVAFTGFAAAQDANLQSGSTYWQGQELQVGSLGAVTSSGDDLQIREYDRSDDVIGSLVEEVSFDGSSAVIDTDDLDGNYVITNSSSTGQAIEFDTNGDATGNVYPRDGTLADNDPSFEVGEQIIRTLEFETGVTDNGPDATVELELDSNRGSSTYNVSADGDLDHEELFEIFSSEDYDEAISDGLTPQTFSDVNNPGLAANTAYNTTTDWKVGVYASSEDDYDEKIFLYRQADTEEDTFWADIDEGEYEFLFDVVDTTAEASPTIAVRDEDQDGSFSQGVYQQTAGDIVEFELELEDTDEVWVQIGDEDAGFIDVVYIEADDEDESISFQVNTRTLGADSDIDNVYSLGDNVDTFESGIHSATTPNINGTFVDEDGNDLDGHDTAPDGNFENYLVALDLIDSGETGFDQLTRPMQPTDYELIAAADGDDGVFIANDDDEGEADNELDTAVLELQAPGLSAITTWVAPEDNADEDDSIEDLLEVVTERSDIALDDRLVVQYEASGLYGAMVAASDDDFDILEDGSSGDLIDAFESTDFENDGINFVFETDDAVGNQDPTSLDWSAGDDENDIFVLIDNDGGQFFVIVDTTADVFDSGEPEDGDTWDIELEYETDDDDRPKFNNTGTDAFLDITGYPYFAADSTASITAEIDFEEPEVTFNNLNADNEIQAENVENSEISGVTNIAPGSSGEIRVASTDASASFRMGEGITINNDGEISAEFDFSGQEVGDEFDTRFRVSGSNIDTVDSVIVEEGTLGVADPVDDEEPVDEEPADDDEEPVDEEPADDDDSDDTDDETPGFGVIVALLAILSAALLATRRQN